ncbi:hypothetical protein THTE_3781 [Thermogutta terrifontis]|uniref:Uncharacterized protein n=1 Tax=Thermogutta terrifontis TaxID=1331910 RepID=A0A286RKC4_9BACT|nr:hypothetical protein THTE_3781 [Thermogutta terrifontis]
MLPLEEESADFLCRARVETRWAHLPTESINAKSIELP